MQHARINVFLGIWGNRGGRDNTICMLESQRLLKMRGICVRNKRMKSYWQRATHVVTRKTESEHLESSLKVSINLTQSNSGL